MAERFSSVDKGPLNSLTALYAILIAIVQSRVKLLAIDLEEDRHHLFYSLIIMQIALVCIGLGAALAFILLVVIYWNDHYILVLSVFSGLLIMSGLLFLYLSIQRSQTKPDLLAATLAELYKDVKQANLH